MIKKFATGIAGAALMLSSPACAQDEEPTETISSGELNEADMADFATAMGGMFQAEPLTADQEARLPAAQQVVGKMMPDGFYAKIMADTMGPMFSSIFSMFGGPEMVVSSKFVLGEGVLAGLDEEQKAEVAAIVDPAYADRGTALSEAMNASMADAFTVLEGPMRDGLSRAYAARFDQTQLADIESFFSTPTGSVYASESMALFSDPQVMQSMMGSLPAIMGSFGGMEKTMEDAMASLPAEKSFADLSASERSRLGQLLGMKEAELKTSMEEAAVEAGAEGDWEE